MLINIDAGDARPLYLQIMDEVRRALVIGTLTVGDPLPSVRELAGELGVNPRTVLQAYQQLEREGLVSVRRGQGTFVSPGARPDGRARRALARKVAERALLDARRNGLDLEELIEVMQELVVEEQRVDTVSETGDGR